MRTRFSLEYRRRLICLVWLGIVVDILSVSWNFVSFNGTSPLSDGNINFFIGLNYTSFGMLSSFSESVSEEWKAGQQRLFCWISSSTNKNRIELIENTWGKRCDILLFKEAVGGYCWRNFFFLFLYPSVNILNVIILIERETKEGWKNIHDRHVRNADWFLKTADDR